MFGLIFIAAVLLTPPTGWLFDEKSGLLIFLRVIRNLPAIIKKFYTYLFYANELGELPQIKNSGLQTIECACKNVMN